MSKFLNFQNHWMGVVPYQEGLALQERALEEVKASGEAQFLGLEHPGVITLGLRGAASKDLTEGAPDFPVVRVQRGGEATIHNRGQLVIYPIFPIKAWGLGVREFVELLMRSTEGFFAELGVETLRKKEPGLYTAHGKIAFLGLQVQGGVSSHGLAINVTNDLSVFQGISVCGVSNQPMDSLSRQLTPPPLEGLYASWLRCFEKEFSSLQKLKNRPLPVWQSPPSVREH